MGSCHYYIRIYTNNELVRTFGGTKKTIFNMVNEHYPHIYEMAPKPHDPSVTRDPTMIMMWKVNRRTKKRELQWVIRGFEAFESYKRTSIFVPMAPLYFDPDTKRDQTHCFMKLLRNKYRLVSFDEFKSIFFPDI